MKLPGGTATFHYMGAGDENPGWPGAAQRPVIKELRQQLLLVCDQITTVTLCSIYIIVIIVKQKFLYYSNKSAPN